uniref:MHC class I-like antigen recognition-like domain-containing protein n=1 Tax=Poecilia formosa TaxID=48698 RepID=A0A096MC61_POEFO
MSTQEIKKINSNSSSIGKLVQEFMHFTQKKLLCSSVSLSDPLLFSVFLCHQLVPVSSALIKILYIPNETKTPQRARPANSSGTKTLQVKLDMEMFLLLLLLHCVSSVKHTLMLMGVGSSGLPNLPTFCANIEIDEIRVAYCDSNRKTLNSTFDSSYSGFCFHLPDIFANKLNYLKDFQYEAVDILQVIAGCEWDDVTGEAGILLKHAYNGEDLFEWDVKNLTWIAKSHQAVMVKDKWKNDEDARLEMNLSLLMKFCPERLKKDVAHGDNSQQKRGLPSVSLLQKTPSSPIRCHVTGFYPNRGQLYWRENGEEIHEYVEHGLGEVRLCLSAAWVRKHHNQTG